MNNQYPYGFAGPARFQSGVHSNVINQGQSNEIRREAAARRARRDQNPHIIAKKEAARAANAEKKMLRDAKKMAIEGARYGARQRRNIIRQMGQDMGLLELEGNAVPPVNNIHDAVPGERPNILPTFVPPQDLFNTMIS